MVITNMIYKYFSLTFETNSLEFNDFLPIVEIRQELNYVVEFVNEDYMQNISKVIISRKNIGKNEIKLERLCEDLFCLSHNYIGSYFINIKKRTIKIICKNKLYQIPFMLNTVTGFIFSINNILCLHGSAVYSDKDSIAFVVIGNSGSGKSTFVWNLISNFGFHLLSDDIVPIYINEGLIYTQYGTNILKATSDEAPKLTIKEEVQKINDKIILKTERFQNENIFPLKNIIILKNRASEINGGFCINKVDGILKEIMINKFIKDRFLQQMDIIKIKEIVNCIVKNSSIFFLTIENNKEKLRSNVLQIYNNIINFNNVER